MTKYQSVGIQFRKEIGLPPLAEYLKLASEGLYSGKPIRMPRDDE